MAKSGMNASADSSSTTYTLQPVPPLLPFLSDVHLLLLLPTAVYWAYGLFFFWLDTNGYLSKYRLHTPAEVLKRNKVSMSEVVRSILFYQLVTTALGFWLMRNAEPDLSPSRELAIATWIWRIGEIRKWLGFLPFNSTQALDTEKAVFECMDKYSCTTISTWESLAAKMMYRYIVPAIQYAFAISVADTWQYFEHRVVHMNHWLYTNVHAVHHRIYVPYAFGAFYANMYEQFVVDVFGTYLAINLPRLSTHQAIYFTTLSTLKAAHDHCGYSIPWHPFEFLSPQNAFYHDIHHQSWGIKTNFSQLYTTFWDRALGTMWDGEEAALEKRYEGVTEVDVGKRWRETCGSRRNEEGGVAMQWRTGKQKTA